MGSSRNSSSVVSVPFRRSIFETFEGQQDGKPNASANVYELSSGKAYVWNDPKETDIRNDLGQDRTGEPVFFTCPVGDINFKGDELSDIDQYPRSIWISSEKDEEILPLPARMPFSIFRTPRFLKRLSLRGLRIMDILSAYLIWNRMVAGTITSPMRRRMRMTINIL